MQYDENTHTTGQLDMSLLFACETIYGCLMTANEFCKFQQFLCFEQVIRVPHGVLYLRLYACRTGTVTVTDSPM